MTAAEEVPPNLAGKEFVNASLGKRAATMAAGPVANFLLAFIAYVALGMSGIPHPQPIIGEIQDGSVAAAAGFHFQDKVLEIDGKPIKTWFEMRDIIAESPGKKLNFKVARDDQVIALSSTPDSVETLSFTGEKMNVGRLGIARGSLTSIISVTDSDSPAAKAGLVTGEQIVGLKTAAGWLKVQFWHDFLKLLDAKIAAGETSIEIQVLPTTPEGEANKNQPIKTVTLPLVSKGMGLADAQLVVGSLEPGFSADLQKNDRIVSWNGEKIRDIYQLSEMQMKNKVATADLEVLRGFTPMKVNLPLKQVEIQKPSGKDTIRILPVNFLGQMIEPEPYIEQYDNVFSAIGFGIKTTAAQTVILVETLAKLVTGNFPLKALGGPMMIAKVAGDSAKAGWKTFVNTLALISVNLAVINLFPIPVLDGGQLVICGIEAIRRRRLSELAIENFQKIGFVMILALVVLATYNDLSRFWTTMLESVAGYFQ
jgi:regulator of sigma E protease